MLINTFPGHIRRERSLSGRHCQGRCAHTGLPAGTDGQSRWQLPGTAGHSGRGQRARSRGQHPPTPLPRRARTRTRKVACCSQTGTLLPRLFPGARSRLPEGTARTRCWLQENSSSSTAEIRSCSTNQLCSRAVLAEGCVGLRRAADEGTEECHKCGAAQWRSPETPVERTDDPGDPTSHQLAPLAKHKGFSEGESSQLTAPGAGPKASTPRPHQAAPRWELLPFIYNRG